MVTVLDWCCVVPSHAEQELNLFFSLLLVVTQHFDQFANRLVYLLQLLNLDLSALVMASIINGLHMNETKVVGILVVYELLCSPLTLSIQVRVIVACHSLNIIKKVHVKSEAYSPDYGRGCNHKRLEPMLLLEGGDFNAEASTT